MHPILFKPFGFAIYSYSLVLIVSFITAMALAVHLGRRRGPLDPDYVQELAMWGIIWGLIGSRLGWVFQHPEMYLGNPLQIFNLREGGMTIMGGIIVPVLMLTVLCKRRGIDPRNVLDTFSAPLLLGMALGRVGCVMHGCCYGNSCPADFPFALTFPQGPSMPVGPRYPTQVFEALGDLALMALIIWMLPRVKFAGQAIWATLGGYGLIRFSNEFFRADGREVLGDFTISQLTALAMAFLGLAGYLGLFGRPKVDVSWQVGPEEASKATAESSKKKSRKSSS